MLDDEKRIPEVEFTFVDDGKSEEERKMEIEELKRKRDELYSARMRAKNSSSLNAATEKMSNDSLRRGR